MLMNIINSSMQSWFYEFSNLRLFEFDALKKVSTFGHTLSIEQFTRMQCIYRLNVTSILRNVWHRGAIAIIKKYKFLRRKEAQLGKWTLGGMD